MKRSTTGRNCSRRNTREDPNQGVNVRGSRIPEAISSRRITRSQWASSEASQSPTPSQANLDSQNRQGARRVNNSRENEPLVLIGNGRVETLTQNQEDTRADTEFNIADVSNPPLESRPRLMNRTTVNRQLRRPTVNVESDASQDSSSSGSFDFENDLNNTINISSDDDTESRDSPPVLSVTDDSIVSSPSNETHAQMHPVNYPRYVEDSVVVLDSSEDEDNVAHVPATNNNVSSVDDEEEETIDGSGGAGCLNWQCPVCLRSMIKLKKAEVTLVSTVCGHIFCANCADRFMKTRNDELPPGATNKVCPVCRKPITRKSVHPIYL